MAIRAATIEVICDGCGEPIPAPCGSHFWTEEDVQHLRAHQAGQVRPSMVCDCGRRVLIVGPVIRSLLGQDK